MTAFQKREHWELLNLVAPVTGDPVLDVTFDEPTLRTCYAPAALAPRVIVTEDWSELGGGYYLLRFTEDDLTDIGKFAYRLTSVGIVPIYGAFDVDPAPLSFLASPAVCIVSGNVLDLSGKAPADQNQSMLISFRTTRVPQQVSGLSLLSARLITTTTDAYGNFSVALLRNAEAIFEADSLGLKQQITVPDQETANIIDLLPPIP